MKITAISLELRSNKGFYDPDQPKTQKKKETERVKKKGTTTPYKMFVTHRPLGYPCPLTKVERAKSSCFLRKKRRFFQL